MATDLPLRKKGAEPHFAPPPFSVHVYCGQTTEWIKMAVGMEMGLGPADIVLDGDPAAQEKRPQAPTQFSALVHCDQMARLMKTPEVVLAQATLC